MDIGRKEISDILEEKYKEDFEGLREFRAKGRYLLSDVRKMTVTKILDKLKEIGLVIDKDSMEKVSQDYYSAIKLADDYEEKNRLQLNGNDVDFFWMAFIVLWEKWFPERLNVERVDDMMQEGYGLLSEKQHEAAMDKWWDTWQGIKLVMDKFNLADINSFEQIYSGSQSVFNWSTDFDLELDNASHYDQQSLERRIQFCSEYVERSSNKNELNIQNLQSGIAESYIRLGQNEKGDKLYEQYLKEDPAWGWGWIYWADQYSINGDDPEKALKILKKGIEKVDDGEEIDVIIDRMRMIYEELGREGKLEELKQLKRNLFKKNRIRKTTEGRTVVKGEKIGRNDPCPCGSGKKHKKCCGR